MKTLKFPNLELEFNFIGTEEEEKIASSLIQTLYTTNLIRGLDVADIKRHLGSNVSELVVYEFIPPLKADEFAEKIKNTKTLIYGIYGNDELLDMNLINTIEKVIADNSENYIGSPVLDESIKSVKAIGLLVKASH